MKIALLYFKGCPSFQPTLSLLQQVLDEEGNPAKVHTILVESELAAKSLRFPGSPSIRVDGQDIELEPPTTTDFGIKCRIYNNEGVPGGVPAKSIIREAIRKGRKNYKLRMTEKRVEL